MTILLHYLYGDLKSLSMRNRPFCALFEVAKMAENRRPGPFAKLLSRTIEFNPEFLIKVRQFLGGGFC